MVVQAGGKGSRMKYLTENRPKCLVSIGGQPLLHSISQAFGNQKKVVIVADYKADVLENYLRNFPPPFEYAVIKTTGTGTSSGLEEARRISDGEGFAIVWSDLFFTGKIDISCIRRNTIGVTNENACRWSVYNGNIVEEPNSLPDHFGIPGIFFFPQPDELPPFPGSGEFVRFLSQSEIHLESLEINSFREIGSFDAYRRERDTRLNSRFFNNVHVESGLVYKEARDANYRKLISDEVNWYKFVSEMNFASIPLIQSFHPLSMSYIDGFHPYEIGKKISASVHERKETVSSILSSLDDLHHLGSKEFSQNVAEEVYVTKTLERIKKIAGVIPNAKSDYYIVDGRKVMNLLHPSHEGAIREIAEKVLKPYSEFKVIHGDPTFSNIIIKSSSKKPVFIDPRGYFGSLKIFGDPLYDFSKLYYSAVGNYDFFNQGRFSLRLNSTEVNVKIESEGFEKTESLFEDTVGNCMPSLKVIHAFIWLSLSGYVVDDHDAILASYFHGLKLFQEVWDEYN